jgi:hypothetical protein
LIPAHPSPPAAHSSPPLPRPRRRGPLAASGRACPATSRAQRLLLTACCCRSQIRGSSSPARLQPPHPPPQPPPPQQQLPATAAAASSERGPSLYTTAHRPAVVHCLSESTSSITGIRERCAACHHAPAAADSGAARTCARTARAPESSGSAAVGPPGPCPPNVTRTHPDRLTWQAGPGGSRPAVVRHGLVTLVSAALVAPRLLGRLAAVLY